MVQQFQWWKETKQVVQLLKVKMELTKKEAALLRDTPLVEATGLGGGGGGGGINR